MHIERAHMTDMIDVFGSSLSPSLTFYYANWLQICFLHKLNVLIGKQFEHTQFHMQVINTLSCQIVMHANHFLDYKQM